MSLIIPFKETQFDKELGLIWRTQLRAQISRSGIPSYIPTYYTTYLYRLPSVYLPIPYTLQGTNISHLGKRKIIFKSALVYFSSQEGTYSNYLLIFHHLPSLDATGPACNFLSLMKTGSPVLTPRRSAQCHMGYVDRNETLRDSTGKLLHPCS